MNNWTGISAGEDRLQLAENASEKDPANGDFGVDLGCGET